MMSRAALWALMTKGKMKEAETYTRDLWSMVDEVHSGIGVVAESDFLIHKYFVGEGVQDFGLLVLRRIGFGGVFRTAEGIVVCWTPVARLERCRESGNGEGEKGKEDCELHCRYLDWRLG